MSVKTDKFKLEFTKLSATEKNELIRFIAEYQDSSNVIQENLSANLRKSLGPTDAAKCGCCGR